MRLILLTFLFFFNIVLNAQAAQAPPSDLMVQANKAFEDSEYKTAVSLYEQLTSSHHSMQLYHNLGLSYFYDNQLGQAILNMERASRLNPINSKVRKNLKLLYENVDSEIQNLPPFFLRAWVDGASKILGSGIWLLIHLLFLFLGLFFLYRYLVKSLDFNLHFYYIRGVIIGFFSLSLLFGLLSYNALRLKTDTSFAIVMKSDVALRAGAENNSLEVTTLSEGLKVKIEDEINGFYQVKLSDMTEGWVSESDIERVSSTL